MSVFRAFGLIFHTCKLSPGQHTRVKWYSITSQIIETYKQRNTQLTNKKRSPPKQASNSKQTIISQSHLSLSLLYLEATSRQIQNHMEITFTHTYTYSFLQMLLTRLTLTPVTWIAFAVWTATLTDKGRWRGKFSKVFMTSRRGENWTTHRLKRRSTSRKEIWRQC